MMGSLRPRNTIQSVLSKRLSPNILVKLFPRPEHCVCKGGIKSPFIHETDVTHRVLQEENQNEFGAASLNLDSKITRGNIHRWLTQDLSHLPCQWYSYSQNQFRECRDHGYPPLPQVPILTYCLVQSLEIHFLEEPSLLWSPLRMPQLRKPVSVGEMDLYYPKWRSGELMVLSQPLQASVSPTTYTTDEHIISTGREYPPSRLDMASGHLCHLQGP